MDAMRLGRVAASVLVMFVTTAPAYAQRTTEDGQTKSNPAQTVLTILQIMQEEARKKKAAADKAKAEQQAKEQQAQEQQAQEQQKADAVTTPPPVEPKAADARTLPATVPVKHVTRRPAAPVAHTVQPQPIDVLPSPKPEIPPTPVSQPAVQPPSAAPIQTAQPVAPSPTRPAATPVTGHDPAPRGDSIPPWLIWLAAALVAFAAGTYAIRRFFLVPPLRPSALAKSDAGTVGAPQFADPAMTVRVAFLVAPGEAVSRADYPEAAE